MFFQKCRIRCAAARKPRACLLPLWNATCQSARLAVEKKWGGCLRKGKRGISWEWGGRTVALCCKRRSCVSLPTSWATSRKSERWDRGKGKIPCGGKHDAARIPVPFLSKARRRRAACGSAADHPRRAERCRGARSDGFCAGNDFPTHFFVGVPVAAREGESARRRSSGCDKRGAETWRIPAFAECRRRASGKVENGKKKGKRLVNVNIVLKVCFGVGKMDVEKTVCFLCTMHRGEARKMAKLTYPVGIKKRSDWVNYIYVIGAAWS
jgi:hypothetical protein